jgi:glutamate transport system substrate-binding protein
LDRPGPVSRHCAAQSTGWSRSTRAASSKYEGFDIEIARLIAAKLGFDPQTKIEYKPIPSAAREQAIINGQIDYYVGTYTINDARKKQISFAGPYFIVGQALLVKADDRSITGPETLTGKRVCSATGSSSIQRVREQGLTDKIVEFQNYSQCTTPSASTSCSPVRSMP